MMDVREKLVELICRAHHNASCVIGYEGSDEEALEEEVRYLISNGVTVQEWISVKDRLPEQPPNRVDEQGRYWVTQNIDYIVYDGKIVFVAHYSFQNKFFWYSDTLHPLKNITHWMEIPQPPKGE